MVAGLIFFFLLSWTTFILEGRCLGLQRTYRSGVESARPFACSSWLLINDLSYQLPEMAWSCAPTLSKQTTLIGMQLLTQHPRMQMAQMAEYNQAALATCVSRCTSTANMTNSAIWGLNGVLKKEKYCCFEE